MKLTIYANHLVPDGEVWVSPAGYEECATKLAKSQPTAPNPDSPKCQYTMLHCVNEGDDDKCGNCHVSNFVALRAQEVIRGR